MDTSIPMYAAYTRRANASVLDLIYGLPLEARNAERRSYYGGLAGLAVHIVSATLYFHGLYRQAPAAAGALAASVSLTVPESGPLTAAEWEALRSTCRVADDATMALASAADAALLAHPIAVDWYGGDPATVPLGFLLHQLYVHGTHHRGQVSQILDELGVEHDFSGIDLAFNSRSRL